VRYWIFFPAIVILGVLQTTVLDFFRVFGVKPDLLLISVVIGSLVFGFKRAFILSVFAGVFKDALGVNIFGINTLLFPLWSFLIARLNREITIDYNLVRIALAFIISLIHNTITGLILIYSGSVIPPGLFLRIVFLQSVYTALILPLVFKISAPIFLKDG
jgi:rod shape-determining protein MreD